jgi:hypothetical protein
MTLTNGETFGKVVYLAVGADPDNWREIPDSEAKALQAERLQNEMLPNIEEVENNG